MHERPNHIQLGLDVSLAASRLRMARIEVDFLKKVDLADTKEMLGARQEMVLASALATTTRFNLVEALTTATAQERLELANLSKGLELQN